MDIIEELDSVLHEMLNGTDIDIEDIKSSIIQELKSLDIDVLNMNSIEDLLTGVMAIEHKLTDHMSMEEKDIITYIDIAKKSTTMTQLSTSTDLLDKHITEIKQIYANAGIGELKHIISEPIGIYDVDNVLYVCEIQENPTGENIAYLYIFIQNKQGEHTIAIHMLEGIAPSIILVLANEVALLEMDADKFHFSKMVILGMDLIRLSGMSKTMFKNVVEIIVENKSKEDQSNV